jgi:hypothetical protein
MGIHVQKLGQPEIGHLGFAGSGEKDVSALDVSVNNRGNALAMQKFQP